MKLLYSILALVVVLVQSADVAAEKICVKASLVKGKKVKLARTVVASSSACPHGSIDLFDTASLLKAGAVTSTHLANESVTSGKLSAGAVSSDKLTDGAVGPAKIASSNAASGAVLTADGAGGAQFSALAAAALPASAALLDRSDQVFTGVNQFPAIQIMTDKGSIQAAPIGAINRDNTVIAWGRVDSDGAIPTSYNITSVIRDGVGRYTITVASSATSGFSLIPIVTPEIDPDGGGLPPTGTANMRISAINQVSTNNVFNVYMYNGQGALTSNDFVFVVFGR